MKEELRRKDYFLFYYNYWGNECFFFEVIYYMLCCLWGGKPGCVGISIVSIAGNLTDLRVFSQIRIEFLLF